MMDSPKKPLTRIIVTAHPKVPGATEEAELIAANLATLDVYAETGFLFDEKVHRKVKDGEFDLMIALGGDGTMLRAGHLCGPSNVPILGINLGRFGFLMEIQQAQWSEYLPRLVQGNYWLESRMMLFTEQWRSGAILGSWDVLNEVVVSRGQIIRPVHLETYVDGRFLTTYVADALIAATPTGSTAYALAAGGPILPPELRNILLVPVAPHLSLDRAVILAEGSYVSIQVQVEHQAVFSVDGQVPIGLADGDRVDVRAGKHAVKCVRFQDPGYFYRNLTPHMSRNPSANSNRGSV
jgi:NAD+ kinase